ncbi:MAG: hypothetical protein K4304_04745 [Propionicimonas sp.]
MRILGRLTRRSIVSLVAFVIGASWASWLYLVAPEIELRSYGPVVTCFALNRDPLPAIYPVLNADDTRQVSDYLEETVRATHYSSEQREANRRQVALQAVAGCQEARLNRQTNLFMVLAGTIAVMVLASVVSVKPIEPKGATFIGGESA